MAAYEFAEDNPDKLVDIALRALIKHHEYHFLRDSDGYMSPRHDVALPFNLSENFLRTWQEERRVVDDRFINIFKFGHPCQMPLKQICIRNSQISSKSVHVLMEHQPTELILCDLPNLTWEIWDSINKYGSNLVTLFISEPNFYMDMESWISEYRVERRPKHPSLIDCPNLRVLCYHRMPLLEEDLLEAMLHSLTKLTYLDLCRNHIPYSFDQLNKLTQLTTLKLHGCRIQCIYEQWDSLCRLKKLRCLDISQYISDPDLEAPDLGVLVRALPDLHSLDISGTSLAGPDPAEGKSSQCSIPGLEGRHLSFLGLLKCPHNACERENIPAKQVTGTATEEQIILSLRVYAEREQFFMIAMQHLLKLHRYGVTTQPIHGLSVLVDSVRVNLMHEDIQTLAMNVFFHLVKRDPDSPRFSTELKRKVILTVLDAMETHRQEEQLLRQGGLTLCQFRIPQDMMFSYKRIVRLLIHLVDTMTFEEMLQRIGIYLLNSLACQVEGVEKQLLGDEGIIKTILHVIYTKWEENLCNELLEVAWSTLWNVTDETPVNSRRFLEGDGMGLFLKCSEKFPMQMELLKNMMGLMGNVAEVHFLRHYLMRVEFIEVLSDILSTEDQNIEISYNACGVLAHMISDGAGAWTIEEHFPYSNILSDMENAIRSWDIQTKRNINYRSFEPIMRLVPLYDIPTAQLWATWALCNLTTVYPIKYCSLVEKENGVELLEHLCNDPRPYSDCKKLARAVIDTCRDAQLGIFKEVEAMDQDFN